MSLSDGFATLEVHNIVDQIVIEYYNSEKNEWRAMMYLKGCEALLISGVPRHDCAARLHKLIRDRLYPNEPKREWHSGYFWEIVGVAGFSNLHQNSSQNLNYSSNSTADVHRKGGDKPSHCDGGTPAQESANSSHSTLRQVIKLIPNSQETYKASPYYALRLRYWDILERDKWFCEAMQEELLKNYEDMETDEAKVPDLNAPRDWSLLFSSVDIYGQIIQDSDEDIERFFKGFMDIYASMFDIWRKCMDNRQSLLPFMLLPSHAKVSITSKKHFSTKYYVMLKRKFDITTKKCTQFLTSQESIADLLNTVKDESWKWHFIETIPCPNCLQNAPEVSKRYLLKMHAFIDGTWKWKCSNCDNYYPAILLKEKIEILQNNKKGAASRYLRKTGMLD